MRSERELLRADGNRLRNGDLLTGFRFVLRKRNNDGQLHHDRRAVLQLHGDGQRQSRAGIDSLPKQHFAQHCCRVMYGSGDVHRADGQ